MRAIGRSANLSLGKQTLLMAFHGRVESKKRSTAQHLMRDLGPFRSEKQKAWFASPGMAQFQILCTHAPPKPFWS